MARPRTALARMERRVAFMNKMCGKAALADQLADALLASERTIINSLPGTGPPLIALARKIKEG